jgi:hypothetical protein
MFTLNRDLSDFNFVFKRRIWQKTRQEVVHCAVSALARCDAPEIEHRPVSFSGIDAGSLNVL